MLSFFVRLEEGHVSKEVLFVPKIPLLEQEDKTQSMQKIQRYVGKVMLEMLLASLSQFILYFASSR